MESTRIMVENTGILVGGYLGLLLFGVTGLFFGLTVGYFLHHILAGFYRQTRISGGSANFPVSHYKVCVNIERPFRNRDYDTYYTYDTKAVLLAAKSLDRAYRYLGIDRGASEEAIRRRFKKLMSKHHPDKLIARECSRRELEDATEKSQRISWAYRKVISSRRRHLN